MKAYKKVATIVPIAILSTSVLFSPVMTFAAEKKSTATSVVKTLNTSVANQFSQADFENWLNTTASQIIDSTITTDGVSRKGIWKIEDLGYIYSGSNSLELSATPIGDGSPELVSLGELHNKTNVNQVLKTNSRSLTTTHSISYSNSEGAKITIGSEIEGKIGIPLVAEAKETIKMSLEGNYQHTESATLTNTQTDTFPSQDLNAEPHGTTKIYVRILKQQFSGKDTSNSVEVQGKFKEQSAKGTDGSRDLDIYNIVKGAASKGIPLPSYVELDDINDKVIIKNMTINFSGVAGYNTEIETLFIPDNPSKKPVKMSLEEYKNPTTRAKLLQ
ncbi:ETX/MTX2 family pore-forming toxin [Bacillus cereus]